MAMADAHGAVARSRTVAAVAVKRAAVVVSMTYGDDGPKWREVGGAMVVAGNGRARARRCSTAMATHNVASPMLN